MFILMQDAHTIITRRIFLGAQGRCRGLKVVKSCSREGSSHSLVQTLLLYDVSFSHNAQRHRQTDGEKDGQIILRAVRSDKKNPQY